MIKVAIQHSSSDTKLEKYYKPVVAGQNNTSLSQREIRSMAKSTDPSKSLTKNCSNILFQVGRANPLFFCGLAE